jgi:hypothetical protein
LLFLLPFLLRLLLLLLFLLLFLRLLLLLLFLLLFLRLFLRLLLLLASESLFLGRPGGESDRERRQEGQCPLREALATADACKDLPYTQVQTSTNRPLNRIGEYDLDQGEGGGAPLQPQGDFVPL